MTAVKNLKENLICIINLILGALTFALFAIPYAAYPKYTVDISSDGLVYLRAGVGDRISGYDAMKLRKNAHFEFVNKEITAGLASFLHVAVLIAGILMLIYGIFGLLKALRIFKSFPDKIGSLGTDKIGEFILIAYAVVNIFAMVALLSLCGKKDMAHAIVVPNVGMFIAPLLSIIAYVVYKVSTGRKKL